MKTMTLKPSYGKRFSVRRLALILLALCVTFINAQGIKSITSVAYNKEQFAVAMSHGGVTLYDASIKPVLEYKSTYLLSQKRVNSLVWNQDSLYVASNEGLSVCAVDHDICKDVASNKLIGVKSPITAIAAQGELLWLGGDGSLIQWSSTTNQVMSTWKLPKGSGKIMALLPLGHLVYVGTENKGVQILAPAKSVWKGYDQFDGLPGGEVIALTLIGRNIYVGTLQGLGRIDLILDGAEVIDSTKIITGMTSALGKIYIGTIDGIYESSSMPGVLKWNLVSGTESWIGHVGVANGLIIGSSEDGQVQAKSIKKGVLSGEPPTFSRKSLSLPLSSVPVPNGARILARVWYPETPRVIMDVFWNQNNQKREFQIPSDVTGSAVVEIAVLNKDVVLERRTIPVERGREIVIAADSGRVGAIEGLTVYEISYKLKKGETLRHVSERFYGDRDLSWVIMEHNKIVNAEETWRLPIGFVVKIPVWESYTVGERKWKDAMDSYKKALER